MWCSAEPNNEKQEDLYSFTTTNEAFDDVNKTQIFVDPQPLRSCVKPTCAKQERELLSG